MRSSGVHSHRFWLLPRNREQGGSSRAYFCPVTQCAWYMPSSRGLRFVLEGNGDLQFGEGIMCRLSWTEFMWHLWIVCIWWVSSLLFPCSSVGGMCHSVPRKTGSLVLGGPSFTCLHYSGTSLRGFVNGCQASPLPQFPCLCDEDKGFFPETSTSWSLCDIQSPVDHGGNVLTQS